MAVSSVLLVGLVEVVCNFVSGALGSKYKSLELSFYTPIAAYILS